MKASGKVFPARSGQRHLAQVTPAGQCRTRWCENNLLSSAGVRVNYRWRISRVNRPYAVVGGGSTEPGGSATVYSRIRTMSDDWTKMALLAPFMIVTKGSLTSIVSHTVSQQPSGSVDKRKVSGSMAHHWVPLSMTNIATTDITLKNCWTGELKRSLQATQGW